MNDPKPLILRVPADARTALKRVTSRVRRDGWRSLGIDTERRISQSSVVAELLKQAARK